MVRFVTGQHVIDLIELGFNDTSPLWVILCHLPEKGRREIGDNRGDERGGQGERKMNESEETEEITPPPPPSTFTCCKESRPCPTVSQYQLHDTFASPNHPSRQRVYIPCLEHLSENLRWIMKGVFFFFFFFFFEQRKSTYPTMSK